MQLRRVMTGGTWLPEIDGLRFLAIASVLISHALTYRLHTNIATTFVADHRLMIAALGGHGVLLFFMISGFILARPMLRAHLIQRAPFRLGPYYFRRVTRLEPPYIVSLLLCLAFYVGVAHDPFRADLVRFFQHLFYFRSFMGPGRTLNNALWSLEIEIQFYAIAPLMGLVYLIQSRSKRWILWGVLIAGAMATGQWAATTTGAPLALRMSVLHYLAYFLIGFLAADLVHSFDRSKGSVVWDVFALLLWPALVFVPEGAGLTIPLTVGVIFFSFLSTLYGKWGRSLLSLRPIAIIGGMCYSIYLNHLLCFAFLGRLDEAKNHIHNQFLSIMVTLLVMIPLSVLFGLLFYIAIERPCMDPKWPGKLRDRVRQMFAKEPDASKAVAP